jgi:hypothetical protein
MCTLEEWECKDCGVKEKKNIQCDDAKKKGLKYDQCIENKFARSFRVSARTFKKRYEGHICKPKAESSKTGGRKDSLESEKETKKEVTKKDATRDEAQKGVKKDHKKHYHKHHNTEDKKEHK